MRLDYKILLKSPPLNFLAGSAPGFKSLLFLNKRIAVYRSSSDLKVYLFFKGYVSIRHHQTNSIAISSVQLVSTQVKTLKQFANFK